MLLSSIVLAFAFPLARAAIVRAPRDLHDHSDEVGRALPGSWYHEPDHPVHALFKRAPGDGTTYAPVGTPEWSAGFPLPGAAVDPSTVPQEWVAALQAAVADGKIADIPSALEGGSYPGGLNPNSPQVCSAAAACRIPGDIWSGPDGIFASSFDDGPLQQTPRLVTFLQAQNLTTTHFMIGVNILYNPTQFLEAFDAGNDIAVHTWSHPHMTTLSNVEVVGQLGWVMQLIHNSTGGRVPRYWRPPYGESDMRVRSIAKEVFGLDTVIWNHDSGDWAAGSEDQVVARMTEFLRGPKSPGLITLNHENSAVTVGGFITSFPQIATNGWTFRSLAQVLSDGHSYQNAQSSTSEVLRKGVLLNQVISSSTSSTVAPSPTTTASASTRSPSPSTNQSSAASFHPRTSCHLIFLVILSSVVFLS